ncbi:hypothetical protein [Actinokineospora sp. NBRC 105648]|uniref:hypothetical protein n=1 Tax=Actinokineospora sp. NBRC 105648 TaxID=3032206 RepID=UPI0024A4F62A|nr:hypothetical protein [Actinokineospora sp. NBRC 105648]GLZ40842.1 hypothetical protein Acsp05_44660 [Actinokineospora sp. NBRC 105648]
MSELDRATARLLEVFPGPLPAEVDGCPCCVSAEDRAGLAAGSPAALDRFAHKAMTTWGGVDDFRAYLPELAVAADLDSLLAKLSYARWTRWAAVERDAVRDFLLARGRSGPVSDLDDLARFGLEAASLLDHLRADPTDQALRRIAEVVTRVLSARQRDPGVVAWLLDPRTAAALEDGFFRADAETAAVLSAAVDELELLRSTT